MLLAVTGGLLLAHREQEPPPAPVRAASPRLHAAPTARAQTGSTFVTHPAREPAPLPPKRDPLLTALPLKPDSPVVVFEVNALRYSSLGEHILACVRGQGQERAGATDMARRLGIDPLADIDRVAFLGSSTVVSGHFDRARWNELGSAGEGYGQSGRIYTTPGGTVGAWRDQIVVLSSNPEDVRTAIDQLEGRAPVPQTDLPEEMSSGEIYGLVPGAAARQALGADGADQGLTEHVASLASGIELHVDTMQDLTAEVRVRGDDAAALTELAKGVGTALTAARLNAQLTGNKSLSALLEKAAVRPREQGFSIQLAVPADRIGDLFNDCKMFGPSAALRDDPAARQRAQVGGPT